MAGQTGTADTTDEAVGEFIERMGVIAQADGLPRIAGRLMGFFVIHGARSASASSASACRSAAPASATTRACSRGSA